MATYNPHGRQNSSPLLKFTLGLEVTRETWPPGSFLRVLVPSSCGPLQTVKCSWPELRDSDGGRQRSQNPLREGTPWPGTLGEVPV